jgi:choline monooxygenase
MPESNVHPESLPAGIAGQRASLSHEDPGRRYLLPADAYFSPDWFEREMRDLFGRSWVFAGIASDLAQPGAYVTARAGYHPLVVVRGEDGVLRGFHNICRHRGAQLLEGSGIVPRGISCFYHRWHYNLDGSLRGVPQAEKFPCLDRPGLALKPAAVGEWNGFVFVHPDSEPSVGLDAWLAPLTPHYGPWRPDKLLEAESYQHIVAANWKLFVENHIDGYHLFHLHAQSIQGLDHHSQAWKPAGRHWRFYEPEIRDLDQVAHQTRISGLPKLEGVHDGIMGSSVFLIFPTLGIAAGDTYFALLAIEPLSAESCKVSVRSFVSPKVLPEGTDAEAAKAFSNGLSAGKTVRVSPANPDGDFLGEDVYAAEALQRSLRSSRFEVGPLAQDYEDSIPFFQQSVLDHVEGK